MKNYINVDDYESFIMEEGAYYPLIFNYDKEVDRYYVYMPIKDCNDDISVGDAPCFEEAYEIARKYLVSYRMRYNKCPKYVNPYNIEIEDEERLVMVKYS